MFDQDGELVCVNQFSNFVRGAGGYGGRRDSKIAKPTLPVPERNPDVVVSEKTSIDQVNSI